MTTVMNEAQTTTQRSGLPPRPKPKPIQENLRLPKLPPLPELKARKSVKQHDGSYSIEERNIAIQARDVRFIKHLVEFGVLTRPIMALLTGASTDDIDSKLGSIKNRAMMLEQAGLITSEGKGRTGIIRPLPLAYHFYPHSLLDPSFLTDEDLTHQLNVSACAARVSRPAPSDHPFGAKFVGWPVLSAARIRSDYVSSFSALGLNDHSVHQYQKVVAQSLNADGWPRIAGKSSSLAKVWTSATSDEALRMLHSPVKVQDDYISPGAMFQPLDAFTQPVPGADFVVPLPQFQGASIPAIACLVLTGYATDEAIARRLTALTTNAVPFTKIAVFLPTNQADMALKLRKAWKKLLNFNPRATATYGPDDLLMMDYEPVSVQGITPAFGGYDKFGTVKSWVRG